MFLSSEAEGAGKPTTTSGGINYDSQISSGGVNSSGSYTPANIHKFNPHTLEDTAREGWRGETYRS